MKTIQSFGFLVLAFAVLSISFSSCKKEEEPSYKFVDQNLKGNIGDQSWGFVQGYYEIDGSNYRVRMYENSSTNICDPFTTPAGSFILATVPTGVALHELSLTGQNITLYDGTTNYIADEGAIEILSVSNGVLKGRLDASYDSGNSVNGNFELELCD